MKFAIEPTADRLLVKPLEIDEIVKGGIIIPDVAQEKPQQATVVAAGPEAQDFDGARVLYGKYSGTEVTVDGVGYLMLRAGDILARLRPIEEDGDSTHRTLRQAADHIALRRDSDRNE